MPAKLTRNDAITQLRAECAELLRNAQYADGQAICLTADTEAIERLLAALDYMDTAQWAELTEAQLRQVEVNTFGKQAEAQ